MSNGMIFDIKEFAINDGPGIRLTVFMKGCPLRCLWCHNPEGLSDMPQKNSKNNQVVGRKWSSDELVKKIVKFKDVFELSSGGITFSGGEPLLQSEFLYDVVQKMPNIHKTLDTSGYCEASEFAKILGVFDLIYYDLKLVDEDEHIKYTGVSNKKILDNLKILSKSETSYHLRIPLIPNVTDTKENLNKIKNIILSLDKMPLRVDPLPYNMLAGGKYASYGMTYTLKGVENIDNNIVAIDDFKKELRLSGINVIGDEIKCFQNV